MIKLVRDKIPEITGRNDYCVIRDKSSKFYKDFLTRKLHEEIGELLESFDIREFADVYEVLNEMKRVYNISDGELEAIRNAKNLSNGSFTNGIIMKF